MSALIVQHLAESTAVCLLFFLLSGLLRQQTAGLRHNICLLGILKFLFPTIALTTLGGRMASAFPAAEWVLAVAAKVSAFLTNWYGAWPVGLNRNGSLVAALLWAAGSCVSLLKWRISLHRARQMRYDDASYEPALVGILRPVVLIPKGLSGRLNNEEMEAILRHELSHAARFDNLTAAVVHILTCLFWFHPLLWFLERHLNNLREQACDEAVLALNTSPHVYVAALAKVCRFHILEPVASVSSMAGGDLSARFERILGKRPRSTPLALKLALVAVVIFVAAMPIASGYCEQCVGTVHTERNRNVTF